VGPRAGLDGRGKSRPPLGFDPRTVQPAASRSSLVLADIEQKTHNILQRVN
jgi:hypothetical protein